MERSRSPWNRGVAAAALSVIGLVVQRNYTPTGITEAFGLRSVAGLFVIFLLWLVAVVGWGRAATGFLGASDGPDRRGVESWSLALGLGSLFAAAWAGFATPFGSRGVTVGSAVFLLGGAVAFAAAERTPAGPSRRDLRRTLLGALVAAYVVVRFVQATRLARHGDPLYYHLVAPVMWARSGFIGFDPSHPLNFVASLWEYLYLWPAQWFSGPSGVGLPAIQIFGQWIHLSVGWMGMGLAVISLLRRLRFPPLPALIGGFAALSTRSLWWAGALAKNDCGAALWLLSGVLLLWGNRRDSIRRYLAAGMLIGAAFVAKYTVAFLVLPLMVGWTIRLLRRASRAFPVALASLLLGASLSAGPILARNYLGTGLPLFPVSMGTGNSDSLSESSRAYIEGISPGNVDTRVSWRLERLAELSVEGPLAVMALLIPVLLLGRLRGRTKGLAHKDGPLTLFLVSFGSLLCFLAIGRPGTDFRLLGPGIVLLNASGTLITLIGLRGLARRTSRLRWIPAGFLTFAAMASTCRFAPEAILDRFRDLPLQRELLRHTGGDAKVWAASHVEPTERIVTTGDDEIYYLLGHEVHVATDDIALDRLWREEISKGASVEEILVSFRDRGFRYLLDTSIPGEVSELSSRVRPSLESHPEWTVFQGRDARFIDLRRVTTAGNREPREVLAGFRRPSTRISAGRPCRSGRPTPFREGPYFPRPITVTSTRRFFARPSAVPLSAIGLAMPSPPTSIFPGSTPRLTR